MKRVMKCEEERELSVGWNSNQQSNTYQLVVLVACVDFEEGLLGQSVHLHASDFPGQKLAVSLMFVK